jgi:hypothetical protein
MNHFFSIRKLPDLGGNILPPLPEFRYRITDLAAKGLNLLKKLLVPANTSILKFFHDRLMIHCQGHQHIRVSLLQSQPDLMRNRGKPQVQYVMLIMLQC